MINIASVTYFRERSKFWVIILEEGVDVDPEKIKEIMDWPAPRNVYEVRSLMGLAIYYMRFIKGFSNIKNPITSLQIKWVNFVW
jgi:hypothetical protein